MANATLMYACTQEGLFVLTKPGTLTEWLPPRRLLPGQAIGSVWAEPGPPIRVLAVSEGEMLLSESGGRTWQPVDPFDGPAKVSALFQAGDPTSVYASAEDGRIAVSYDSGATWAATRPDSALLNSGFTVGGRTYLLTPEGVRVSEDSGETWTTIPGSPAGVTGGAMVVVPGAAGKPPALIIGAKSGLTVSPDGGGTWRAVDLPVPGGISALARDPERRDRLYAATTSGHLLESGDRAQTWQVINPSPLPPATYIYAIRI